MCSFFYFNIFKGLETFFYFIIIFLKIIVQIIVKVFFLISIRMPQVSIFRNENENHEQIFDESKTPIASGINNGDTIR
jgi:hypothetical protein